MSYVNHVILYVKLSCVSYMSYVSYLSYVNYMSYVSYMSILWISKSVEIAWNVIFLFSKILNFSYVRMKNLNYKNKNIEKNTYTIGMIG